MSYENWAGRKNLLSTVRYTFLARRVRARPESVAPSQLKLFSKVSSRPSLQCIGIHFLVILPNVAVGLLKQFLVRVQLVLEQSLA